MPQYSGFESSDWLTIITIIITVAIQSWGFFKWQTAQFQKRDEKLDACDKDFTKALEHEASERQRQIDLVRDRAAALQDMQVRESARLDREQAATRHELSMAISNLPTRDYIERMFGARFKPLEEDLRSLVLELARNGLPLPDKPKQ